jgi:hypothetical protein
MVAIRATASGPLAILSECVAQGATHLVFVMNTFWWSESYPELTQHLSKTGTPLVATPEFKIYTLSVRTR